MRRRGARVLACAVAGVALLAGCSGSGAGTERAGAAGAVEPVPTTAPPAVISVTPANATGEVRPDAAVDVKVAAGTLDSVTVTPDGGAPIAGTLADGGLSWTSFGKLRPGTTYRVSATAKNASGAPATTQSSFTTLTPAKTVTASLVPGDGWTVGVGMPVIVDFSKPVKDRAAAVAGLKVESTPAVEGSWRWFSSKQAQWRPRDYWAKGTTVKVTADLAGIEVSPGVWGKSSKSAGFTVGSAMVSTVDMKAHTLTVKRDGKVLRTIPITTGKSGFVTRKGVKVIMSRESSRQMNSETTGIGRGNAEYYNVNVKWAMRLTHSGEFLHAAPWSVGSQGRANVSHGCTGMSTSNAKWLFDNSKVGDVVIYSGSNRSLEWGNGYTAWDMSYDRWKSA